MGKSTAVAMLRRLGCPVHDADAAVHGLMAPGGAAVEPVARAFPGMVAPDGGIDRHALGAKVLTRPAQLRRLEAILHPLVTAQRDRFVRRIEPRVRLMVFDIPLLFETGVPERCDFVAVVSAPRFVQRQRFLKRAGASEQRFQAILSQQMPDWAKRRLADFVVPSGLGRAPTLRALNRICKLAKAANRRKTRRLERRRLSMAILASLGVCRSRRPSPRSICAKSS